MEKNMWLLEQFTDSVDPDEYFQKKQNLPKELKVTIDFFEEYGDLLDIDVQVLRSAIVELEKHQFDLDKLKIEFATSYLKTGVTRLHEYQSRLSKD